ncbi:MazG nucleotide pyrophosphohydrolase domain-containing protein [Crossiella sp. CA-258035]|uniref:MazG nucleotide pyrophosphohydrolase domain-containing protein n=1 Tax=Crossiella sp. CA-258035 TaxID=2981138 RepID=UPI0024BC2F69|nr:MazG nucleotide pyrophosphohydrolase domain-containing protein [Crossiella sp. CA-258035]WHT20994.1 MazG nucleotide pyrophosphohydrolase domain-containing protein [Crossiella sp. CA-258035]
MTGFMVRVTSYAKTDTKEPLWHLERATGVAEEDGEKLGRMPLDAAEVEADRRLSAEGFYRLGGWERVEYPSGVPLSRAWYAPTSEEEASAPEAASGLSTWDKYQEWSAGTAIYSHGTESEQSMYEAGKLAAEAAEVFQVVAKAFRDGTDPVEVRRRLVDELGDCAWYLAQILRRHGIPFDEVLDMNQKKLERRQANGTIGGSGER